MAEKAEKKAEAPAAGHDKKEGEKAGGGGMGALMGKTPVLLGVAMFLEAVVLFAGFKFIGGGAPQAAPAAVLATEEGAPAEGEAAPAEGDAHAAAPAEGEGGGGAHGGGEAATPAAAAPKKKGTRVEVPVVEFRAPNASNGRRLLIDVSIYAVTKTEYESRVKDAIKDREAMIKDRIRTIIAQSDPEKLGGQAEPGLETLRRQVKYQLDEIIGSGMIDEVLVPRCIPMRVD